MTGDGHLFSFHGFGDRKWERQSRSRLERRHVIRTGEPKVEVVKNALFVPAASEPKREVVASQIGTCAGLFGSDGQPIAIADLQRGITVFVGTAGPAVHLPVVDLDEPVVYLGWLLDYHFGHFLLKSLARTWILNQVEPTLRVVFHHRDPSQTGAPPWARQILEAFGVPWSASWCPRFRRGFVR